MDGFLKIKNATGENTYKCLAVNRQGTIMASAIFAARCKLYFIEEKF